MDSDLYIKQLMAEQTYGFVLTMLYFREVKKEMGEHKALKLLEKAAIERRKSWYESLKKEMKGDEVKTSIEKAADLILKFWIEATPKDIRKEFKVTKKEKEIIIETEAWCPICEAAEMLGLNRKTMCDALGVKADEWLASQVVKDANVSQVIFGKNSHRETISV